jgi:hypothetical protein
MLPRRGQALLKLGVTRLVAGEPTDECAAEPLRGHCLRQLIAMSRATVDDDV